MSKTLILAIAFASTIGGFAASSANATSFADLPMHTTAALCRAIYDEARLEPNSSRESKDAYIACVGRL